jgi:hypothetical protein
MVMGENRTSVLKIETSQDEMWSMLEGIAQRLRMRSGQYDVVVDEG